MRPFENEGEQIFLQGLSVHKAQNEEDALNLLFIGDTNRVMIIQNYFNALFSVIKLKVVAETPSNDASTRSHCIFIV